MEGEFPHVICAFIYVSQNCIFLLTTAAIFDMFWWKFECWRKRDGAVAYEQV